MIMKDGNCCCAGDYLEPFTMQSVVKPLILLQALMDSGIDTVRALVGVEATGKPFDTFNYSDQALTGAHINPMINTGAIARGLRKTPYPADYLLQILLDEGGKPVLGSDSHDKHNLVFAFDQTVNLLKTIGFKHIYRFNGRGFDSCEI